MRTKHRCLAGVDGTTLVSTNKGYSIQGMAIPDRFVFP